MEPPVTECAYITLKAGVEIEEATDGARIWQETLKTLSDQEGYQRCYYGRQVENQDILMLLVDWTTLASHQAFTKSPIYASFKANVLGIAQDIRIHHVIPTRFPPKVLSQAPCIEFATFHGVEDGFIDRVAAFAGAVEEGKPDGFRVVEWGGVVEDVGRGGEGVEGRAVVLWIGWDSVEAHMKFRETELFRSIIGPLRKGNSGVEMFHVAFKAY